MRHLQFTCFACSSILKVLKNQQKIQRKDNIHNNNNMYYKMMSQSPNA